MKKALGARDLPAGTACARYRHGNVASFCMGLERHADSADDQKLWIDEVAIAQRRIGCPKTPAKTSRGGVE